MEPPIKGAPGGALSGGDRGEKVFLPGGNPKRTLWETPPSIFSRAQRGPPKKRPYISNALGGFSRGGGKNGAPLLSPPRGARKNFLGGGAPHPRRGATQISGREKKKPPPRGGGVFPPHNRRAVCGWRLKKTPRQKHGGGAIYYIDRTAGGGS